ncbi:hypothetical protein [Rubrivirga sp.]|uniref:hypothetical protein n=1 Tax=Rubrivirga sp. TaxID=1885344 RepID=UPI003C755B57
MRILFLTLALAGCSQSESGTVEFEFLIASSTQVVLEPVTIVRSAADEANFRERLNLVAPFARVDYDDETLVVVSTFGGCPSTAYDLSVLQITDTGGGLEVEAEVTNNGSGGDLVSYPFWVVTVPHLDGVVVGDVTESRVTLRLTGDAADDCVLD